ncbi:hypothetical protein FALCPG4_017053 [Fusarium falciforme]
MSAYTPRPSVQAADSCPADEPTELAKHPRAVHYEQQAKPDDGTSFGFSPGGREPHYSSS